MHGLPYAVAETASVFVQVNELQRRQRKEHEKEVKRREKLQEKEKTERAAQAKLKMEEEAYQLQVGGATNRSIVIACGLWPCHAAAEFHTQRKLVLLLPVV